MGAGNNEYCRPKRFTLDTAFQRRWDMKMIENDVSKATHAKTRF